MSATFFERLKALGVEEFLESTSKGSRAPRPGLVAPSGQLVACRSVESPSHASRVRYPVLERMVGEKDKGICLL